MKNLIDYHDVNEIRERFSSCGENTSAYCTPVINSKTATGKASCRSCGDKIKKGDKSLVFPYSFTDGSYNSWTAYSVHIHLNHCRNKLQISKE